MRQVFVFLVLSALFCAVSAFAQDDAPSLGDVARQARQQKQQKDAPSKDASAKAASAKDAQSDTAAKDAPVAKPSHVITNEELPRTGLASESGSGRISETSNPPAAALPSPSGNEDSRGEQWKSQIQGQKSAIASLQQQINTVSESIHYAGANCVANCAQWNERQKQKQDEVESMKAQLAEQQKRLEEMQESARKQGFGSSVYDP
jgi:hypothetical protein